MPLAKVGEFFGSYVIAVATAFALIATPAAHADTAEKKIGARAGWQNVTYVKAGQFVDISADGRWTVDYRRDEELGGRVGPDGYDWSTDDEIGFHELCHVTDSAPYGTLIGRIDAGRIFVIGGEYSFEAKESGQLQLRINDSDACLGDNAGRVNVTVEVD